MATPSSLELVPWTRFDFESLKPLSVQAEGNDRDTLSHYLTALCRSAGLDRVVVDTFLKYSYRRAPSRRKKRLSQTQMQEMYFLVANGRYSHWFAVILRAEGYNVVEAPQISMAPAAALSPPP